MSFHLCSFALSRQLLAATTGSDSLSYLFARYAEWVGSLSDFTYRSIFRAAVVLILVTIGCSLVFRQLAARQTDRGAVLAINWVVCLAVVLVVAQIPLSLPPMSTAPRAFIYTVSMAAIGILPWRLAFLLCPVAGFRRILAAAIYGACLLLLFVQPGK